MCLLRLLAFWIASGHDKSQVPIALAKARDVTDFLASDTIKSVCQFEILSEQTLMKLVCQHLDECSVFEKLEIENRSWNSYSSLVKDLPVAKKQEKMAKERLDKIQEYNERRARTRTVLGSIEVRSRARAAGNRKCPIRNRDHNRNYCSLENQRRD